MKNNQDFMESNKVFVFVAQILSCGEVIVHPADKVIGSLQK